MDDNIISMTARRRSSAPGALLPLRLEGRPLPGSHGAAEGRTKRHHVVLDRDDRTCRFCGFRATQAQQVIHLNGDARDDRDGNLATACSLCYAAHHLGAVGRARGGLLIWLPEMTQVELHHAVRAYWVLRSWASGQAADRRNRPELVAAAMTMARRSEAFLEELKARSAFVEKLLGSSEPETLGLVLRDLPDALRASGDDLLRGIRLLPSGALPLESKGSDQEVVASWLEVGGPFSALNPRTWLSMGRQMGMRP